MAVCGPARRPPECLRCFVVHSAALVLLSQTESQILGCATVEYEAPDRFYSPKCYLKNLVVRPEARR